MPGPAAHIDSLAPSDRVSGPPPRHIHESAMTTFVRRVVGALGLDPLVYEDVEADRSAWLQALLVVAGAGVAAGIGNAGITSNATTIVAVAAASILAWLSWGALVYYLGTRALPDRSTSADLGQVLRTLGFAAAPGLFRAFEVFGQMRWLVLPLTALWMMAAMVVALRQALDYSTTGRAVALAALGWAVTFGAALVIGLLLARPVS